MMVVPRCLLVLTTLLSAVGRTGVGASLSVQPLANPEVLEPSVQNEVEHALSVIPEGPEPPLDAAAVAFVTFYATNGMNATERAISLVSAQKGGNWFWRGTNVTPVAAWMLRRASGCPEPRETTNVVSCVRRALQSLR